MYKSSDNADKPPDAELAGFFDFYLPTPYSFDTLNEGDPPIEFIIGPYFTRSSAVVDMPPERLYERIRQRPLRSCENSVFITYS